MTVLASYIDHRTRERRGFGPCVQTPFNARKVQCAFSDRSFPQSLPGERKVLGMMGLARKTRRDTVK